MRASAWNSEQNTSMQWKKEGRNETECEKHKMHTSCANEHPKKMNDDQQKQQNVKRLNKMYAKMEIMKKGNTNKNIIKQITDVCVCLRERVFFSFKSCDVIFSNYTCGASDIHSYIFPDSTLSLSLSRSIQACIFLYITLAYNCFVTIYDGVVKCCGGTCYAIFTLELIQLNWDNFCCCIYY